LNGELSKYIENYKYYDYGELLKAFFSIRELEEGEHEIIIISYIFFANDFNFITIIDDNEPRNFIEHNFPEILQNMTGTVGFVKRCNCKYAIFGKDEAITILNLIKNSKFRIKGKIIDDVIKQIKLC
jgi:predicted nucleic acid-binding protein